MRQPRAVQFKGQDKNILSKKLRFFCAQRILNYPDKMKFNEQLWFLKIRNFCQEWPLLLLAPDVKKLSYAIKRGFIQGVAYEEHIPREGGKLVHDVERSGRGLIWGIYVTWLSKTTKNVRASYVPTEFDLYISRIQFWADIASENSLCIWQKHSPIWLSCYS